jgi:GDP-L-fucose synthase
MNLTDKIYVTGHKGLVGSALCRKLKAAGYNNIITSSKSDVDLRNQKDTQLFFEINKPDYVFLAAAKVGGIQANNIFPAEFINDNIQIQSNVINSCYQVNVKKLMFLGSVCIYPKYASVPVREDSLLTGELEPTNQWYAIAKIAGIKMCQAFKKQYGCNYISVMPCNLYGINDNFHPENSHVLPAFIRRFHEAKMENKIEVVCWGTGTSRREFMDADDLADGLVFLMNNYDSEEIINIGYGEDYTIKDVANIIKNTIGFTGKITWDSSKPDGTPKRLLDSSKLFNMGWKPKVSLNDGLRSAYAWYLNNKQ